MPRTSSFFVLGLLLLLFVPKNNFAQKETSPGNSFVGIPLQNKPTIASFTTYEAYSLPLAEIHSFVTKPSSGLQIRLRLGQSYDWQLNLSPHDLRSGDYQAFVQTETGKESLPPSPTVTYKATLAGKHKGSARITLTPDFIYGFVQTEKETFYIEPLGRFEQNAARNKIVVYPKSAVKASNLSCGLTDERMQERLIEQQFGTRQQRMETCKVLELAIAHDFSMFEKYGDIASIQAYTLGVMNNVEAVYSQGDFNSDIRFQVVEQFTPICENCGTWTDSNESIDILEDFTDWANDGNFVANHDLGQFWTNRDLVGSTVGLAYVGTVCGAARYHILQDFSYNADIIKVTTAHEIGHNLNASHNASSQGNIMDPMVNNTSSWSATSIASINAKLASISCLDNCPVNSCPAVKNLKLTDLSPNQVSLSWTAGGATAYDVELTDLTSNVVVSNTQTANNSISMSSPLELCKDYLLSVTANCGAASAGTRATVKFQTSFDSYINILAAEPTNCAAGLFDLSLTIEHRDRDFGSFHVIIDGVDYPQTFDASPQTVLIQNLRADGREKIRLAASATTNGTASCSATATYDAPDAYCSLKLEEDFNDCRLPEGWTNSNTTRSNGNIPSTWLFSDGTRSNANLPTGSIDGTCMVYFDDDLYTNIGGTMELTSPVYDLSLYGDLFLQFDYDFISFENIKSPPDNTNNSFFKVEVFDGDLWQSLLLEEHMDDCDWFRFWTCPCKQFSANLDAYKNPQFQIRFTYSDGNKWSGAVGFDNFKITGVPACSRPKDIQSTTSVLTADYECTDSYGWTHYWKSGSPDILLLSIKKNDDPTLNVQPKAVKVGVDFANLVQNIPVSTPYVHNAKGWEVMSRFWDVNLSSNDQPSNPVSVRFYYTTTERDAILLAGRGTVSESDLIWYKFASGSGIDPNPRNGHLQATSADFVYLSPSFGAFAGHRYAEFTVDGFSGGGGGAGGGFLPIELTSFEGYFEGEVVKLKWHTEWEEKNSHFIIERSNNGIDFNEIGREVSSGSPTASTYRHTDNSPIFGINYYRLKQVDLDGEASYSKVITLYPSIDDDMITLSPNPATSHTQVNISTSYGEEITIQLMDMMGKTLYHETAETSLGFNQYQLPTEGLTPGIYLVRIKKQKQSNTLKLMIL